MELLLGIEGGSKYVEATYRAAKLAGVLPLLWLSMVVVAPVTEELLFRGFLHRGWAPSWLGVVRHDRPDVGAMGRVASAVQPRSASFSSS